MEGFGKRIETVQSHPAVCYPDLIVIVDVKGTDPAVGWPPVIITFVIGSKPVPVIAVQPVLGTDPEEAEAVFGDRRYQAV
jgi:hypothetical protein